jgi:hypothetical protein
MGFYKQMDEASFEQFVELWNGDVPEWADSRESLLEEIAYLLSQSDEGVNFLKGYGQDGDIEKRKAAVYFLAHKPILDAEILNFLDKAFYAAELELKSKALWGYLHIGQFPMSSSLLKHSPTLLFHTIRRPKLKRSQILTRNLESEINSESSFVTLRRFIGNSRPQM